MTCSFVQAGPDASKLLAEMHQLSFQDQVEQSWSAKDFEKLLSLSGMNCVILQGPEQLPLGFSLIRRLSEEAEIITFCILPKYRGRGIGQKLLNHHMDFLKGYGLKHLFLEVREDNIPAIMLYEKAGFEKKGRRKNYYGRAGEEKTDALIMALDINIATKSS